MENTEDKSADQMEVPQGKSRAMAKPKIFITPALDSTSHREKIHLKIEELNNQDSEPSQEIIHLTQCGWDTVGQVVSPTYFIMSMCRKFNLLASERCVLLPLRDQYQAIQLCLAKINKKKHGDFSAPLSDVLDVWNELYRETITCDEATKSIVSSESHEEDCEDLNLPSSRRKSYDPVVREMQEIVNSYQEFLQSSGCIDHFSLYNTLKAHLQKDKDILHHIASKVFIIEGISRLPTMEREILKLLLTDTQIIELSISVPCEKSSSICDFEMSGIGEEVLNTSNVEKESKDQETDDVQSETIAETSVVSIDTKDLESSFSDYLEEMPRSPSMVDISESELYVEQLILAHIRLLINTRDELALALLCSMPGREITQRGFYEIKDEAKKKNMPLYQTILSFVMRLQLGGKGYQDQECPLLAHSKPLSAFVNSIMKLQNIVEEESNPKKGAIKVLSQIKSSLIRIRGRALKGSCIEKVWDSLYSAFVKLAKIIEDETQDSTIIPKLQQTTGALRPCLKLLIELCDEASGRVTEEIVDALGENFLTQCNSSKKTATPIRIPTVLSLFGSPIQGTPVANTITQEEDCDSSLRMRLMRSKGLTPKNKNAPRFKSGCSWAPDNLSPVGKGDAPLDQTLSPILGPTLKAVGGSKRNSSSGNQDWREIVDSVAKEEEERRKEAEALIVSQHASKSKKTKATEEKKSKRSLLSDISNISTDSNKKSKFSSGAEKKSPAKKKSKSKPLLKGQKSITSFFKM